MRSRSTEWHAARRPIFRMSHDHVEIALVEYSIEVKGHVNKVLSTFEVEADAKLVGGVDGKICQWNWEGGGVMVAADKNAFLADIVFSLGSMALALSLSMLV